MTDWYIQFRKTGVYWNIYTSADCLVPCVHGNCKIFLRSWPSFRCVLAETLSFYGRVGQGVAVLMPLKSKCSRKMMSNLYEHSLDMHEVVCIWVDLMVIICLLDPWSSSFFGSVMNVIISLAHSTMRGNGCWLYPSWTMQIRAKMRHKKQEHFCLEESALQFFGTVFFCILLKMWTVVLLWGHLFWNKIMIYAIDKKWSYVNQISVK